MAVEKKKSVLSLLSKEYKYEGLLLLVLSVITILLGVMILIGVSTEGAEGLVVNENFYFIGEYPSAFAWILIVLGVVAFLLAIWPYYKPSIKEAKRISWPSKKTMLSNTFTVIAYVLILAVLFLCYDAILNKVVEAFQWLADLIK